MRSGRKERVDCIMIRDLKEKCFMIRDWNARFYHPVTAVPAKLAYQA